MITMLLIALIMIAIVALIGGGIVRVIPMPEQARIVVWVIIGVICLVILLRALTGGNLMAPL